MPDPWLNDEVRRRVANMTKAEKAQYTSEWVDWVDFGGKAVKFAEEEHKVIDEGDGVDGAPGGLDKVPDVRRLSDYSDLKFFCLGPLYTHVGIHFDILGEFRKVMKYEGPRVVLKFAKPVLSGLNEWDHIVEGVHESAYNDLVEFVKTQTTKRDTQKEYWEFRYREMLIPDPCGVDRNDLSPTEPKSIVGLFTPSGNKYNLVPLLGTHPVTFTRKIAEPSVLSATALLYNVTFNDQ
jgi:hypothetical protein